MYPRWCLHVSLGVHISMGTHVYAQCSHTCAINTPTYMRAFMCICSCWFNTPSNILSSHACGQTHMHRICSTSTYTFMYTIVLPTHVLFHKKSLLHNMHLIGSEGRACRKGKASARHSHKAEHCLWGMCTCDIIAGDTHAAHSGCAGIH